jgi:hypothetical protein
MHPDANKVTRLPVAQVFRKKGRREPNTKGPGTMTREDWKKLLENFDTTELLSAVDAVDELRTHLNDQQNQIPPQIRTDLLTLHQLTMAVVNEGSRRQAEELFTLAEDLHIQVILMLEFLEQISSTLDRLTALRPDLDPV